MNHYSDLTSPRVSIAGDPFPAPSVREKVSLAKSTSNKKYRTTPEGWLRNYYSRLKMRKDLGLFSSLSFVELSKNDGTFLHAWAVYVASNFSKDCAPQLTIDSFAAGNVLTTIAYAN